jgi:hypothetical protein
MRTLLSLVCLGLLATLTPACGDEATRTPGNGGVLVDGSSDGSGVDLDVTTPDDDADAATGAPDDATTPGPDDTTVVPDTAPVAESNCGNGIDDNFDGNVDCADPSCLESTDCAGLAATEFNCVDGIDNDGNGFADCVDGQCSRSPVCRDDVVDTDAGGPPPEDAGAPDAGPPPVDAGPPRPDTDGGGVPPIPFEFQCDDGVDNDADGTADCDDDNCEFIPPCLGGGGGGGLPPIPFEFQCGDGIDNDADGLLDCDDDNCNFIPPCLGR